MTAGDPLSAVLRGFFDSAGADERLEGLEHQIRVLRGEIVDLRRAVINDFADLGEEPRYLAVDDQVFGYPDPIVEVVHTRTAGWVAFSEKLGCCWSESTNPAGLKLGDGTLAEWPPAPQETP